MSDLLIPIIFGWPGALASFVVSVVGLIKQRYWMLVIGAILLAPFAYYLSGAPGSYHLPMLIPLFLLGSAYAVDNKKTLIAWLSALPAFLVIIYFVSMFIYVQLMYARQE